MTFGGTEPTLFTEFNLMGQLCYEIMNSVLWKSSENTSYGVLFAIIYYKSLCHLNLKGLVLCLFNVA